MGSWKKGQEKPRKLIKPHDIPLNMLLDLGNNMTYETNKHEYELNWL